MRQAERTVRCVLGTCSIPSFALPYVSFLAIFLSTDGLASIFQIWPSGKFVPTVKSSFGLFSNLGARHPPAIANTPSRSVLFRHRLSDIIHNPSIDLPLPVCYEHPREPVARTPKRTLR